MPKTIKDPIRLDAGESLAIAVNEAYVAHGYEKRAVDGAGGNTVRVAGTVTSDIQAVFLGRFEGVLDNDVRIARTGLIESLGSDEGIYALYMAGNSNTLINHGVIQSAAGSVRIASSDSAGTTTITNSGTISGVSGMFVRANGVVEFTHTGTVRATADGTECYGSLSLDTEFVAADHITNKGTMVGGISLGTGDDIYEGRSGTVLGWVYGRDGEDQLMGGREKNQLRGDAGADRLAGRGGADELRGGSDADVFIFLSAKDSSVKVSGRDLILDFSQLETDIVSLHGIDANVGKRGDQAFKFITDDRFHGKAGELHYDILSGKTIVSGDTDGDRKADFSIALDGEIALTREDFIL